MTQRPLLERQRGASLLVALMFLLIMAMLGVTIANVTNLEERMANNTRSRDLAFQAAEAALEDAEARIKTDAAFRAAAIAYDKMNRNDPAFWEACFAGTGSPCAIIYTPTSTSLPTSGPGALSAQPRYVLESKPPSGTTQIYRVTARATGGTDDSIVVLQAEITYTSS